MVLIVIDLIVFAGIGVITNDSQSSSHPEMPALRGEDFNVSAVEVESLCFQYMGVGLTCGFIRDYCTESTGGLCRDKTSTSDENEYNGFYFVCKL